VLRQFDPPPHILGLSQLKWSTILLFLYTSRSPASSYTLPGSRAAQINRRPHLHRIYR